jgi:hypothetical protein
MHKERKNLDMQLQFKADERASRLARLFAMAESDDDDFELGEMNSKDAEQNLNR